MLAQAKALAGSGRLGEEQGRVQVQDGAVALARDLGTVEAAACWLR